MNGDNTRIENVPTNLITGFFGVGKTTAIRKFLDARPDGERWAVLVNEFGDVPIDQAAFGESDSTTESGVVIREISGGCMCCAMNLPMRVAVTELLRQARPDRLLIEPTGLGHPAGIIDELQTAPLADAIDLQVVICLVDPRFIGDPRIQEAPVFRDQVHLADVLIANKADLASEGDLAKFQTWAEELFPAKSWIGTAQQAEIDVALLDLGGDRSRVPLFPDLHSHGTASAATGNDGGVKRFENSGTGYQACGWIFPAHDNFERDRLLDLLGPPGLPGFAKGDIVERLKGTFRAGDQWFLIDRARNEVSVSPIAYRRDSRVEVIAPEDSAPDWDVLEKAILACRRNV